MILELFKDKFDVGGIYHKLMKKTRLAAKSRRNQNSHGRLSQA
jgi:hypothetical protein